MVRKLMIMLIAAVALCFGAFPPQDPEALRSKAFGVVLDLEGEPWAGATVRLFSRPYGPSSRIGTPDSVEAVTDEGGRFRCSVLRGRGYTVWATGEDGRQSNVAEGVFVGDPVELRESRERSAPVRISVKGVEAWAARGPLTWSLLTSTENVIEVRGTLGEDCVVAAPSVPGEYLLLLLMDREGRYLADFKVGRSAMESIELSAPHKVRARFRSAADDKPVVGGQLWWSGPYWQQRGRVPVFDLDVDGRAEFELPLAGGKIRDSSWWFRVTAEGCNSGVPASGESYLDTTDEDAKAARVDGAAFLQCGLERGQRAKGRLLWSDGSPVSHAQIIVRNKANGRVGRRSSRGGRETWMVGTDEDGRFVVSGVDRQSMVPLQLVLTDELLAKLPAAWRGKVRSPGLLGFVPGVRKQKRETSEHDFGNLVLDRDFWPIDFEMRTPNGLPAVGATVILRTTGIPSYSIPAERAGRLGRFCTLVPRDVELHVGIIHEQSSRLEALKFAANAPVKEPQRMRFQLQESRKLAVRVTDRDGKPVPGTRVSLSPSLEREAKLPARTDAPASCDLVVVESVGLDRDHYSKLLWTMLGHLSASTDADGIAIIVVPDLDITINLQASLRADGRIRSGRGKVVLGAEEGDIEVDLRLKN